MTTLIDTAPSRPASAPALVRARPAGLTAEAVFIRRSITHSLRDTEALLMAVILPTMLMLLFTYVFGGALDPSGGYVDYVVPGIILLCAGFGSAMVVTATFGMVDCSSTSLIACGSTVMSLFHTLTPSL